MSAQYRPYRDEESVDGLEATSWSDNEPGTIQIYEKTTEELPFNSANKRALYTQVALLSAIGILGFLLGYFAPFHPIPPTSNAMTPSDSEEFSAQHGHDVSSFIEDPTIKDKLLNNVDVRNILNILEKHNGTHRIPGSDHEHAFAREVESLFKSYDLDRVTASNYSFEAMLPWKPNNVLLLDKFNKTLYSAIDQDPYENDDMRPFLPLTQANRTVITTNQLLYVNRGTKEDFSRLNTLELGSNETEGKVLIIRQTFYQVYDVVTDAQESGAKAILLFPDPEIYSETSPFPKSVHLPNDAGKNYPTAWSNYGDLAQFNFSLINSLETARSTFEKEPKIHIPVIPISFNTAKTILRGLSGALAPKEWNCFDFTLHLGPTYREETTLDSRDKIRIETHNNFTPIESPTVTGVIVGSVEPDRYVVIGSRRDSLNRGMLDSLSGTAVMLEIARVFGLLKKQGWRPKRTIIFNSFGAESFNLIGSSNWLEQHQRLLHSRAVAYVNCDLVVTGNRSVTIAASPVLYQVLYNTTKQVENPNLAEEPSLKTVYDSWKESHSKTKKPKLDIHTRIEDEEFESILRQDDLVESKLTKSAVAEGKEGREDSFGSPGSILHEFKKSATVKTRPEVRRLDLQSIYSPFFLYAGIPVIDVRYAGYRDATNRSTVLEDTMPLIGTKYDNMATVQRIDPHLKYHETVAKLLCEILRDLSDSVFLPFNLIDYAVTLRDGYTNFVTKFGGTFNRTRVELGEFHILYQ